ncbi:OmpA family protein [Natronospirillum operosum]|uniref:OmpA family protein n=1 Tax=Natronospirillum operosum TaxID=2759953 RepID=A0A4Z0WDT0_9GAMM|nr:OmpA family protein [Natronospirillum operosum]TGG95160.1 OmpA family protein [Natronospirillum operosum]
MTPLEQENEEHWLSVSDLMAGLMMVFLLIAIIFMIHAERERRTVTDVAVLYERLRLDLYNDLLTEFEQDLEAWGAELDEDLTFRFNREDLLFDRGETDLQPGFQTILADFFPRYVDIIHRPQYRDDISEVRIEGHTSSAWGDRSEDEAYILNMELSQARTREAASFLLELDAIDEVKPWVKANLTANGLSSSRLVLDEDGQEDEARSRRVEFRVVTDADQRIEDILQTAR